MVNIPTKLQPGKGSASKPHTVGQQKKIKKHGSLKNYEASKNYAAAVKSAEELEADVTADIAAVGLNQVSSVEDYAAKYAQASAQTKKYIDTPAVYKQKTEEARTTLITGNTTKINERIAYYEEKNRKQKEQNRKRKKYYQKRGNDERAQDYDDREDEWDEYYDGVIVGLKQGLGKETSYESIDSYARKLGRYEQKRERAKNRQKEWERDNPPEMTTELITVQPTTTSYTGGTHNIPNTIMIDGQGYSVAPSNQAKFIEQMKAAPKYKGPTSSDYDRPHSFTEGIELPKSKEIFIKKPAGLTIAKPKATPLYVDLDDINTEKSANIATKDKGGNFITIDNAPVSIKKGPQPLSYYKRKPPVTEYVKQEKIKDEIAKLDAKSDWEKTNLFSYDYGQGTPTTNINSDNQLEFSQPNNIIGTAGLKWTADATAARKDFLLAQVREVGTPTLKQVTAASDNRGTFKTIFYIGNEPKISGEEYAYATGKVLQDKMKTQFERDYEKAYSAKEEKIILGINPDTYQKRIDSGEDFELVKTELDKKYEAANVELAAFSTDYQANWIKTTGTNMEQSAAKIYFDAQLKGSAKDAQAKVGKYFGWGTAVGAGTAVASATVVATAPVTAPLLVGGGLVVGGAVTGISIGKSVVAGETTYDAAKDAGFTGWDATARGLLGAATDISPFAFTAAGATVGGVVVGGTIRYTRKPLTVRHSVSPGRVTTKASGVMSHKAQIPVKGEIKPGVKYPSQKIGETAIPGSRAETTTQWRHILNTKFGAHIKPVATGYPSDTTGHTKAVKLYREYGLSKTQATKVVKFIQPQVIEQSITSGYAYQGSNKLVSGTLFTKEHSLKLNVDKAHGVTTRVVPDKIVRTDFSRAATPQTADKTSAFVEVQQSMWTQDGGATIDLPKVKLGISGSKDWNTRMGDNVIRLTETTSASGSQQVGGIAGKESATGYLIKAVTHDPKLTGGSVSNTGSGASKTTGSIIRTDGSKVNVPAGEMHGSSLGGGGDSLLNLAPPTQVVSSHNAAIITPKVATSSALATLFVPAVAVDEANALDFDMNTKTETLQSPSLYYGQQPDVDTFNLVKIDTKGDTAIDTAQNQGQGSGQGTSPLIEPIVEPTPITTPPSISPIEELPPVTPPTSQHTPIIIDIDFGGNKKRIDTMVKPHYGEVMVKGKYQKVTNKPHTKSGARDVIARIIDNTTSAQGRVVAMKKKTSGKKLQGGDGYYDRNKNKFRGFKMFKGKRVAVKDTIIEKKNRRIDTPGEKKGMGVAQFMSQGKKGRPKKKAPFRL